MAIFRGDTIARMDNLKSNLLINLAVQRVRNPLDLAVLGRVCSVYIATASRVS